MMQSYYGPGGRLQDAQETSWEFPTEETSNIPPPSTSLPYGTAAQADAGIAFTSSATGNPQHEQTVSRSVVSPKTPLKKVSKNKKRKAADSDGDYKPSSGKKKTKRAAPTPAKPKSKRKSPDNHAEADYKPTIKITKEYTVEDEVAEDDDICIDDCEEKHEQDMIHCDGEACRVGGKWFHAQCVGFEVELPSNIGEFEWYCPTCRVELGVGEETDGLIYRADKGSEDGGDAVVVSLALFSFCSVSCAGSC